MRARSAAAAAVAAAAASAACTASSSKVRSRVSDFLSGRLNRLILDEEANFGGSSISAAGTEIKAAPIENADLAALDRDGIWLKRYARYSNHDSSSLQIPC